MVTVNFSVPDDVKEAFNEAFEGRNKSAIIADLMREAVERVRRAEPRSHRTDSGTPARPSGLVQRGTPSGTARRAIVILLVDASVPPPPMGVSVSGAGSSLPEPRGVDYRSDRPALGARGR